MCPHHNPRNLVNMLPYVGKGTFSDVTTLRIFELGRSFDFPGGPNLITEVLQRGDPYPGQKGSCVNKKDSTGLTLQVGAGTTGPGVRAATGSWRRRGDRSSSKAPMKERSPASTLILAQWTCWNPDLENYKKTCCIA